MPHRPWWVLLGFVVLLSSCSSDGGGGTLPDADFFVQEGRGFLLRVGDTAGVATNVGIILVRFNGVLGDNRCPVDVECVQAGAATILLSVQTLLAIRDVEVAVPPGGGVEVTVEEVTLSVIELRPPAEDGRTIEQVDYAVALSLRATGSLDLPS